MKNTALGPVPTPRTDPEALGAAGQVLEVLRAAAEPMRVGEIAAEVGSHDNTVRGHLATLIERGLVESTTAPPEGRGRPAVLYAAGPRPGRRTDEYRALAGAFAADLVASGDRPEVRVRARRIGRVWGQHLSADAPAQRRPKGQPAERRPEGRPADRDNPSADPPDAGRARLEPTLVDLGFGPQRDERDRDLLRLTTCPLLDLAVANPDVICQVHLGLVEGVVGHGEGDPDPELTPFAEPGACLLRLPSR